MSKYLWQLTIFSLCLLAAVINTSSVRADEPGGTVVDMPAGYYDEPVGLPYSEEVIEEKQEEGWHWKEFRFTSMVVNGEPTRVHAVYGVPDGVSKEHPVPGVVMTHGVFGAIKGPDARYWGAFSSLVKAGYAVIFFDWYPNYSHDWKPKTPDEPKRFTTFGTLDYFGDESWYRAGQDWKESIHYQVAIAGRRAITWLSAQPGVDATKIGVTGASYGGIFSSLIAGIDPRIKAVVPAVYTSGFGLDQEGYNMLPSGWSQTKAKSWVNRFDSEVLLAKRKLPVLYTVGANDPTFFLSKAMDVFGAMNEPKHILIGANRGHDYWDFEQTILFFDHALKNKMPRLAVEKPVIKQSGREAVFRTRVAGEPVKVEFAVSSNFELDPDKGAKAIPTNSWRWTMLEAKRAADGGYTAQWPLEVMRPVDTNETAYVWDGKTTNTATQPAALNYADTEASRGLVQAFARVTDKFGAVETTPLAVPLAYSDPAVNSKTLSNEAGPRVIGLAAVTNTQDVVINANTGAGETRVHLPVELPQAEVGKGGYVLWNWRKQPPKADLTTEGTATPTKQVFAPFEDTVAANSFQSVGPYDAYAWGSVMNFQIGGQSNLLLAKKYWRGAVPGGNGGSDEVIVSAADDKEHTLTVVMGANALKECNVRVCVRDEQQRSAVVTYRQTDKADTVLQFRFVGKVHVGVKMTSQPEMQFHTVPGPAALFFD